MWPLSQQLVKRGTQGPSMAALDRAGSCGDGVVKISACCKAHAPVLTDANGLGTAEVLPRAWI